MAILYSFGQSKFKKELPIKSGALWDTGTVGIVEVEMTNAGAFAMQFLGAGGNVLTTVSRSNPHGGHHTFNLGSGGDVIFTAPKFSMRLVNQSSGERDVHGGQVNSM
jgi:hypothetical protein